MRTALLTFLVLMIALLPQWAEAGRETLRIGNGPEPETLDPHRVEGVSAGNIVRDLYEGLTAIGKDGRVVPAAATTWTVSEDGLTYTFQLHPEGRWSNGDPVIADDFVAGLQRSLTPATGSNFARMLSALRNAEAIMTGALPVEALGARAIDPLTLELTLQHPAPEFLGLLTHPSTFPIHTPSLRRYGSGFTRPGRHISNGAYRLTEWVVQSYVMLERNAHYRAPASIQQVRYVNTEDIHGELQRYRAGELDITYEIPPLQAQRIRESLPVQLRLAPYLGVYYYGLNLTQPPFRDAPALRRALSMLIDRDVIADKVMHGLALPAYGWVPPGTAGHVGQQPEWATWSYAQRVETARQLYREAGYSDDKPLTVEIRYNTHESHRRVATVVAAMWKQTLGIRTRLINEEFKVFLHNRRMRRDTQVFRAAWIADFNDPMSFLGILQSAHGKNDPGWQNAQYDALLTQAQRDAANTSLRAEALSQAERIVFDDVPLIPIYFYMSKRLVAPRVQGWTDNVLDYHYSKSLTLVPADARASTSGAQPVRERGE